MGLFGPPNIEKLKKNRNIQKLIQALGYEKSDEVRRDASYALADLADQNLIDILLSHVQDSQESKLIRIECIETIGFIAISMEIENAFEPLIACLENPKLRYSAASALGYLGDKRAVEPLRALLDEANEDLQQVLKSSLTAMREDHLEYEFLSDGVIRSYSGDETELVIPDKIGYIDVIGIGLNVFRSCNLTKVTLPETLEVIYDGAFSLNSLTSIWIPDSVRAIYNEAFWFNDLTDVHLPTNLKQIGKGAFARNSLEEVTISREAADRLDRWEFYEAFDEDVIIHKV